jgi:hypothetical protein
VALLERQLEERSGPGVRAQPLEEVAVAALPSVQRGAERPSARPVEAAAGEHAAVAEEAVVLRAAGVAAAEGPAALQAVAGERASQQAEAREELVLRVAARPSAALSAFRPGRVLPWPAPRPAACFAHAMQCSQIAPQTARWWPAARGEVWS